MSKVKLARAYAVKCIKTPRHMHTKRRAGYSSVRIIGATANPSGERSPGGGGGKRGIKNPNGHSNS